LHRAKIPTGAGFLFTLPDLLYPKIDIKIRQLLLFPASSPLTLGAPLNLTAVRSALQIQSSPRLRLGGCRTLLWRPRQEVVELLSPTGESPEQGYEDGEGTGVSLL